MEYDRDDIAKNHGEPEVVFMVVGKSAEKDVEEKHFNKDQYTEAVDWQMANVINTTMSTELENSIKTGKWTKETIDEFNNYIKAIKNEKIDIEQRVGEGRSLSPGRSEIHEGASLVIAAKTRTSKERRGNPQAEYEFDAAEGREQERLLEAWAKAADLWLNDYEDEEGNKANTLEDLLNSQWTYLSIGSEAEVYEYDDSTVLKSINLSHANDNPGKLEDVRCPFAPGLTHKVVGILLEDAIVAVGIGLA